MRSSWCLRAFLLLGFLGAALVSYGQEKILFSKKVISVGSHSLSVEVADNDKKVSRGLMYRTKKLSDSEGMLFVFKSSKMRRFWMKNTFIPLSIGFFDKNKKLIHVAQAKPVRSEMEKPKTYSSKKPAMYVLEVSPGWFKRKKLSAGAKLDF